MAIPLGHQAHGAGRFVFGLARAANGQMGQLPGLFRIGDGPELNFRALLLLIVLQADDEHVAQQLDSAGMP